MSEILKIVFFLCVLLNSFVAKAEVDPNFHIYICFGQSNMEGHCVVPEDETVGLDERFQMYYTGDDCHCGRKKGERYVAVPPLARCFHVSNIGFGPVDCFGRTLVEKLDPKIRVAVVVVAIGGVKIELFQKSKCIDYIESSDDGLKSSVACYGGNPYDRIVEIAKLAQQEGVVKGILVHQGESNGGDENWPYMLKEVYDDLISDLDLNGEDVPLLVGEVRYTGRQSRHNEIIRRVPNIIPNSYVISAEGCEDADDFFHFSLAGYKLLGTRYALKMLDILEKSSNASLISAENGIIPDDEYNVYDVAGRFVKKITVSQNSYKNSLNNGFYILRNSKGKNYTLLKR